MIWKSYLKLDNWIISYLQNLYLWLLDRTGVYVATLMFVTYVGGFSPDIIRGEFPWWNLMFIGLAALIIAIPYQEQNNGDIKRYNAFAIKIEGLFLRHAFNSFQIGLAVGSVIAGRYINSAGCLVMLIYQYLWVIKIRDRDKRPFFEKKKELIHDTY